MGSIDSDAHVIECERTFDFLDPEFEKLRPVVVQTMAASRTVTSPGGMAQRQFWYMDNAPGPSGPSSNMRCAAAITAGWPISGNRRRTGCVGW